MDDLLPIGTRVIITTTEYNDKSATQTGLIGTIVRHYDLSNFVYCVLFSNQDNLDHSIFTILGNEHTNSYRRCDLKPYPNIKDYDPSQNGDTDSDI